MLYILIEFIVELSQLNVIVHFNEVERHSRDYDWQPNE